MNECCKKYKLKNFCADCGSKIETDQDKCPTCNGEGVYNEGMGYGKYAVVCEACFGTGVKQKCNSCGGKLVPLKPGFSVCQSCVKPQPLPHVKI